MTPPSTLLDVSFLEALVGQRAHAAVAVYGSLLDDYQRGAVRLRALRPDLALYPAARRDLLVPVEAIDVGSQHRRAASAADESVPDRLRLAAVMVQREKLARVVSCDPWWHGVDGVDVVVIGTSPAEPGDLADGRPGEG
jgi:hypothetical protein